MFQYEGDKIRIIAAYDSGVSYEVSLTFSIQPYDDVYTFNELMSVYYQNELPPFGNAVQFQELQQVREWLENVRGILSEILALLTSNPENVRAKLEESRLAFYEEEETRKMESKIAKCWLAKDYPEIIRLMKDYNGPLKDSIRKKYAYALKKMIP